MKYTVFFDFGLLIDEICLLIRPWHHPANLPSLIRYHRSNILRCDYKMAAKRNAGPRFNASAFILNNLGYLAFLGGLALLYIGNAHYAEYNIRRIQSLEDDIKQKRWLYMSLQSENMYNGLRSEVVENVRDDGLRMHRGKPKKLVVDD
ncbi:MAG: FtsL-like putative cell division protein [Bacteroidota bacterium]